MIELNSQQGRINSGGIMIVFVVSELNLTKVAQAFSESSDCLSATLARRLS